MRVVVRSKMDWAVSFQQNLIKASNTVGRRFRADVSVAQWRLSAVELYRTLGREREMNPSLSFLECQALKVPQHKC